MGETYESFQFDTQLFVSLTRNLVVIMAQIETGITYDQVVTTGTITVPIGENLTSSSLLPTRAPIRASIAYDSASNGMSAGLYDATTGNTKWKGLITGPETSVSGNITIFNGTNGQQLIDSGVNISSISPVPLTITSFGSTPNLSGGSISGNALTLQPASIVFPGGVTVGNQSFGGVKDFPAGITTPTINNSPFGDFVKNSDVSVASSSLAIYGDTTGKLIGSGTGINVPSPNTLTGVNTLSGKTVANLVTNSGTSTANHLALFSDASGKVVTDSSPIVVAGSVVTGATSVSGKTMANVVTNTDPSVVSTSLTVYGDTTGKLIGSGTGINVPSPNTLTGVNTLSGKTVANLVTNSGTSTLNHIALFSDASGKIVTDTSPIVVSGATITNATSISGVTLADVVTNAGASVANRLAIFTDTTGTKVTDSTTITATGSTMTGPTVISGLTLANVVTNTGASVTNRLAVFSGVTGKLVTDSSSITAATNTLAGVNTITSSTPTSKTVDSIVTGPASSTADSIAVFLDATGKIVRDATGITIPSPGNLVGVLNINGNPVVTTQSTVSAGAFGSTPNANGVSISGANPQILNLQPASATQPGGITTSAQSFAGLKDFSANGITVQPTPLSSGVTSVFNNYAKWTGSMTFTGGLGATNITGIVTAERMGSVLILKLPLIYNSGQAAAFITTTTALPAEFRPASTTESVPLFVINGSRQGASASDAVDNGLIQLLTTGFFNIGIGFDNTETLIPFGGGAVSGSGNGVARQVVLISLL